MNIRRNLRRLPLPATPGRVRITKARAALARAQFDLAWELDKACPGEHWYGNHADGQWCCHCGYDRDGKRISAIPCTNRQAATREDA